MSRIERPAVVIAATTTLFCVLVGVAVAHNIIKPEAPANDDVTPTRYGLDHIDFPTEQPEAAVEETLRGLDPDVITDVRLGSPPDARPEGDQWFYATVRGDAISQGAAVSAQWEADLAQGAVAERIAGDNATDLASVIAGASVTLELPDGTRHDLGGGAGDISPGQLFADQAARTSDDDIAQRVMSTLAKFGITAVQIRVLRPFGPAVYVSAMVDKAGDLNGSFDTVRAALLDDPLRYEGLYLEIDLPDGTPLVRGAQAFQTGAGTVWIAPGLDDAVGANHG